MSQHELERVVDDCFQRCVGPANTLEEHHAAIDVWNEVLDSAIDRIEQLKGQYVAENRYQHAVIARDMSDFLQKMKATHDAPYRGAT